MGPFLHNNNNRQNPWIASSSVTETKVKFLNPAEYFETYYFLSSRELHARTDDKEVQVQIYQMEAEAPFSALGFFEIGRPTLTSLLSTIITYLVVMVQFAPNLHEKRDNITHTTVTSTMVE